MKNLFFLLVLLYANLGFGQSIRDIEFIWLDFDDCKPSLYSEDIFVKVEQDPILFVKDILTSNKLITEKQLSEITDRVKATVEESVQFAEESPNPEAAELYKDVYVEDNYPYMMDNKF